MSEPTSESPDHDEESAEDKPGLLDRILGRTPDTGDTSADDPHTAEAPDEPTADDGYDEAAGSAGVLEADAADEPESSSDDDSGGSDQSDGHSAGADHSDDSSDSSDSEDSGDSNDSGDANSSDSSDDSGDSEDSDEDGKAVGSMPAAEDVDEEAIEEERSTRLDPENRPDNVEIDNTDRTFDSEKGMFTDAEGYDEADSKYDDDAT